jgi:5-oxoprolinase (ATP-hydrolysing)
LHLIFFQQQKADKFRFLQVANSAMCGPIRSLTEGRGHDAAKHHLASFGGAGGQHACAIAEALGIRRVLIHRYSSILSAYGIGLADIVHEEERPCAKVYSESNKHVIEADLEELSQTAQNHSSMERFSCVEGHKYLSMRYDGSETAMMIAVNDGADAKQAFVDAHHQQFGFTPVNRDIIIDSIRVRAVGKNLFGAERPESLKDIQNISKAPAPSPASTKRVYFNTLGWVEAPVYLLPSLSSGATILGPALVVDNTQTIVISPKCTATATKEILILEIGSETKSVSATVIDPVQLSVFRHRFYGIAEQMGRVLQNVSVSANIKERLDFSCAIFSPDGSLVANAPHVPAMIGSMGFAVKSQIERWKGKLRDGDALLSNSPGMTTFL